MIGLLIKIALSYMLGSVSGSMVVGSLHHVDIRKSGSGSAGGTNAFRTQGLKFALMVVLIDIGKGLLAAWSGLWFRSGRRSLLPSVARVPWRQGRGDCRRCLAGHIAIRPDSDDYYLVVGPGRDRLGRPGHDSGRALSHSRFLRTGRINCANGVFGCAGYFRTVYPSLQHSEHD